MIRMSLPVVALLACTANQPVDKGTDTATEVAIGPCSAYMGASGLGTTWEYEHWSEYDSTSFGSMVAEVTEYDEVAGRLVVTESGDIPIPPSLVPTEGPLTGIWTYDYRCRATGVFLREVHYQATYGTGYWSRTTYDPEIMHVPNNPTVGDSWTATVTVTGEQDGDPMTLEQDVRLDVLGQAEKTVPAGTYDTFEVVHTLSAVDGVTSDVDPTTTWFAEDVGAVKKEVSELVSVTP